LPRGRRPSLPDLSHPATRRPGGKGALRPGTPHPARTPPARHLAAGGEAALPSGPPHAATGRPSPPAALPHGPPPPRHPAAFHPTTKQPVGRRARAALLAVALGFGPMPSSCAARRQEIDPGAGFRSLVCLAVQCPQNLGHLANVVPRPRAALRLAGFETRITETCGPPAAV